LRYFNLRGRAEVLRLAFAQAGIEYTDTSFEREKWPEMKPTAPFGQVPILIETSAEGTHVIPQSLAILRHIGRIGNLYGKNEYEHTRVDYLLDEIADWRAKFNEAVYYPNFCKDKNLVQKYLAEQLPHYAPLIEKQVHDNGLLVGDSITIADIAAYSFVQYHLDLEAKCLDAYPKLKLLFETVGNSPKIAAYLPKQRPSDILFFMSQ